MAGRKQDWLAAAIAGLLAVLSIGTSFWASGARALNGRPLLREGLPKTLAWGTELGEGWLRFARDPNGIGSPIAARIVVNSEPEPIRDTRRLDKIFREDQAAFIPPGSKIRVFHDQDDRELWDYPVGTEVVHSIWFKTQGTARLFELRMVRKLADGAWAFGMYTPQASSPFLELKDYFGLDDRNYDLNLSEMGKTHLALKGIQLESCQVCHFMHSTSAYQYAEPEHAGPCGFGPANPGLREAWTAAHIQVRGYDPFEEIWERVRTER